MGCAGAQSPSGGSDAPYPTKPIRIVVPSSAGGSTDFLIRPLAAKLAEAFGKPVLVENRPGAGSVIGTDLVARAAPDGYTLLAAPASITMSPALYKLAFDPSKFVPVGIIAAYPNVLVASTRVPAGSLEELLSFAKANPARLNIASQGNGTSSHLTAELFKAQAGIDLVHVPYKGTAPALIDLLGGQVDVMFDNLITMMPHVKSGKLRLLGVGGERRVQAFPEVPAIAEMLPGFRFAYWERPTRASAASTCSL